MIGGCDGQLQELIACEILPATAESQQVGGEEKLAFSCSRENHTGDLCALHCLPLSPLHNKVVHSLS